MSQYELADAISHLGFKIGQSAIGNLESGKTQTPRFLHELSLALNVSTEWLRYGTNTKVAQEGAHKPEVRAAAVSIPTIDSMPRDLPVLGTVSGGNGQVQMRGEAIDFVRRPPSLTGRADIFGLYVEDVSMVPAFHPGDLVIVERRRPRIGDHCIVEFQDDAKSEQRAIIKKLAAQTGTTIRLEQYNPPKVIEIKSHAVIRIQRVMTVADLFII